MQWVWLGSGSLEHGMKILVILLLLALLISFAVAVIRLEDYDSASICGDRPVVSLCR